MFQKPTKVELAAAPGKTIPDLIGPDLHVLFCGINPGLYSGATGCHFARPGNRFWPALHRAGFTPRLLHPSEGAALLELGYGITNLAQRTTATAAELTRQELELGARLLEEKAARFAPKVIAMLGITAYRVGFNRHAAKLGKQPENLGPLSLWVLPNPSGLNAYYTPEALVGVFREFRE